MSLIKRFASLSLAVLYFPVLHAEPHCPGNVDSIRFHLVNSFQIIVPVRINHQGPYDFLVDTGTQLTMVDSLLAVEVNLKSQNPIDVVSVGMNRKASFGDVASLEVGSQIIANHSVVVQSLDRLQAANFHIRGILGGNFLGHFDVLIDYARHILCLDVANTMRDQLKGEHIALVALAETADDLPLTGLPVISVHLSAVGSHDLLLLLDSGTNSPVLFSPTKYWTRGLSESAPVLGRDADGAERAYSILPPQSVEIGSHNIEHVSFIALSGSGARIAKIAVDGMLTTTLFWRVFVSYSARFAILDPRN